MGKCVLETSRGMPLGSEGIQTENVLCLWNGQPCSSLKDNLYSAHTILAFL